MAESRKGKIFFLNATYVSSGDCALFVLDVLSGAKKAALTGVELRATASTGEESPKATTTLLSRPRIGHHSSEEEAGE